MVTRKLAACFDIVNGRVTKAFQFQDNIDVAPADALASEICAAQIDELIFFDIYASNEKRQIDLETVKKVAERATVPLIVGGGIKDLNDMGETLKAGADKISVDSMAVRNPEIIREGAKAFGSQCIVLSTQVKRDEGFPSGYQVYIDGARTATGMDAIEWLKRGEDLGAGEMCINSIDFDGTAQGFDLPLMKKAEEAVRVPLTASGGAGAPEHLSDLFTQTQAQAAIISSMLYSPRLPRNYTPKELKEFLTEKGVAIRPFV